MNRIPAHHAKEIQRMEEEKINIDFNINCIAQMLNGIRYTKCEHINSYVDEKQPTEWRINDLRFMLTNLNSEKQNKTKKTRVHPRMQGIWDEKIVVY